MNNIINNNDNIKQTICLNMIVKNESHIIKNTLEMLCNKIKFDYWVICDTGSTDGTQDIINNFIFLANCNFAKLHIPKVGKI